MVDLETIENEIINLEKRDTSYTTVERLAWLYICRDHLRGTGAVPTTENTGQLSGSDFMCCCSGKSVEAVLTVISEHMEAIKVLYPKEYDVIVSKINNIVE